jgi:predicted TIM-barrel fold metal-dependent hydrolase
MVFSVDKLQQASTDLPRHTDAFTLLPDPEPRARWIPILSVDDHVLEPPDIFEGRFPKRFADKAPRVVDTDNGGQAWLWQDKVLPNFGGNAVAGRPMEEVEFEPTRFEQMRPGAWDVHARVQDMDIDGIAASVCFPSFLPGFVGQRLTLWPKDEDLALAAMRAYNDWHLEAWCGAYPDRFVPQQIAYLRDPLRAGEEIRRNADRGFKAVTFSEAPFKLGLPTIHSGEWDPFFAACEETETVIGLHVGSAGESPTTSDDAPGGVVSQLFAVSAFTYAVDWLYSGIANRFPNIKIAMSEGGINWVPSVIDRLDHLDRRGQSPMSRGELKVTADHFRRNFWFCALDEPSGFRNADLIGVDHIMVESDYPHGDSTWPNTQPILREHLTGISRERQEKFCWKNASALYRHELGPAFRG